MKETQPDLYEYLDYAAFFRDCYVARHKAEKWFSYRYIQQKTGIDPGFLFKVFQGKRHLPKKNLPALTEIFKLEAGDVKFIELLIDLAKADTDSLIKNCMDKVLQFSKPDLLQVGSESYVYYSHWYHIAIRQALAFVPFRGDNFRVLAKMVLPNLTLEEAKNGFNILKTLGMVEKDDQGFYRPSNQPLSTGKKWNSTAIRDYQRQTILLGAEALINIPKEQRDISTATVTLSESGLVASQELAQKFRHDLMQLAANDSKGNRSYQVNVQLFPITQKAIGGDV